jgi:hypothetical protein
MFSLCSGGDKSQKSNFKIDNLFDDIVLDGMPYKLMAVIKHSGTGGDTGGGHYISYLRQINSFDKLDKNYKINDSHDGLDKKDINNIFNLLNGKKAIDRSKKDKYKESLFNKTFKIYLLNILEKYNHISNNLTIKKLVTSIKNSKFEELKNIIKSKPSRKDDKSNFNEIDIIAQLITMNLLNIYKNIKHYKNNQEHKKKALTYVLNILLLILSTCPDKVKNYRQLQLTQDKFYIADDASPIKEIDNKKLGDYQNGYVFMYVSAEQYYNLQMKTGIVNKQPRPMKNGGNNLCFFNSAFQMLMRMTTDTNREGIQQYFK